MTRADACLTSRVDIKRCLVRPDGTVICFVDRGSESLVLRVGLTDPARARSENAHRSVLESLHENPFLRQYVPEQLVGGSKFGLPFFIERQCSGRPAASLLGEPEIFEKVGSSVARFLCKLAGEDKEVRDGKALFEYVFSNYLSSIAEYREEYVEYIRQIGERLELVLRNVSLPLVRVHGDFNPTNVFCDPGTGNITGVIDWDASEREGLPFIDLIRFTFGMSERLQGLPIRDQVILALKYDGWRGPDDPYIREYAARLNIDRKLVRTFVVILWAKHVTTQLKYRSGELDPGWENTNLRGTLRCLLSLEKL
jgi:aminoglycoside phosphotransferase (APT) family kinase protein